MPLRCALARARSTSAASPSTPTTLRGAARQRQREIAQPAVQVQHLRLARRVRSSSTDGATSARLTLRIDLDEIARLELQIAAANSGSAYSAPAPARRSGRTVSMPPVCRYKRTPCGASNSRSRARSAADGASSTRSTSATAFSATATSICGTRSRIESSREQLAERRDQRVRPAAASTSQRASSAIRCEERSRNPTSTRPFALHVFARRGARAAGTPLRACERRQPALRRQPRDALEVLAQLLLLDRQLRAAVEVLQRAAAADAEMRAARRARARRRAPDREQFGLIVLAMTARRTKLTVSPGSAPPRRRSCPRARCPRLRGSMPSTTPVSESRPAPPAHVGRLPGLAGTRRDAARPESRSSARTRSSSASSPARSRRPRMNWKRR